jgi:hypothetical protein
MRIKVLAVEIKEVKEGKKDYKLMDLSYKNLEFNKVEGKKIVSFASPDVFNALKGANAGEEFDVTKGEKSAAGFVPWTRCVPSDGGDASSDNAAQPSVSNSGTAASPRSSTPRSTYETPEERAKKQVYIVRQSSISNAVEWLKGDGEVSTKELLELAKQFENYVMDNDPVKALIDMEDDIPL